jgi:AhpD family alkylhydroperoxidase
MAMIPLVEPARNEYLAELERKGKNNFFRMMAHKPEVLKSFVPFYGAIMGPGAVDRRTKELVYLAASFANECAYCSAAHRASAKKAGLRTKRSGDEDQRIRISAMRSVRSSNMRT